MERGKLATVLLMAAFAMVGGCSAGSEDETPAIADDGEEAELRALEIADDEPIVDEGDASVGRETAEENPLLEDEEDVPDVELGLTPQVANRQIASSEKRASVEGKKYKCRPDTRDCICQGSPLNCELPNTQPGRNRYLPPAFAAELLRRTGDHDKALDAGRWQIADGTIIYEGGGRQRGPITSKCFDWDNATGAEFVQVPGNCAKINFGQIKRMKAEGDAAARTYVYAFNVYVNNVLDSSGWIPLDSVVKKQELAAMGSHTPRRVRGFVATKYVIRSARDWGQTAETFSAAKLPSWTLAKVAPGPGSKKVGDYVLRDGNMINLCYGTPGVGGVSTDTFYVEDGALEFQRVRSTTRRPTLVRVPVADSNRPSLIFAYGSIDGRFGWVALPAFRKGTARADRAPDPSQLSFCAGKPDGVVCDPAQADRGLLCRGGGTTSVSCQPGFHCVGATASDPNVIQCAQ